MTLFDVDPNSVTGGWMPLVAIALLGVAVFVIFRSMRRQLRRIDLPDEGDRATDAPQGKRAPAERA